MGNNQQTEFSHRIQSLVMLKTVILIASNTTNDNKAIALMPLSLLEIIILYHQF